MSDKSSRIKTIFTYVLGVSGGFNLLVGLGLGEPVNIFWGGALLVGMYLLRQNNQASIAASPQAMRAKAAQSFELTDELIVRLAMRKGGRLRAEDLAAQTSLNIEQAKERLESLNAKGICNIDLDDVSDTGKIYYNFND